MNIYPINACDKYLMGSFEINYTTYFFNLYNYETEIINS